MADQHQAWVENLRGYKSHGIAAWGLRECQGKNRGCRHKPTLFRAGDVFPPGHPRRTIHHDGQNGDESTGQWFGLCESKKSGRPSFRPIFDRSKEPRMKPGHLDVNQ